MEYMDNEKVVQRSLTDFYINNKGQVKGLLRKHGVKVGNNDRDVIAALGDQAQRNEGFRTDLAKKLIKSNSYKSLTGYRNTDGNITDGIQVGGVDPVSAVANAIGSIFGMIGSSQNRKAQREAMEYDMYAKAKMGGKNKNALIIGGVILITLVIGGIIIYNTTKK